MVKLNIWIIFLSTTSIQVMHASSMLSQIKDTTQPIVLSMLKVGLPIATTAAGIHAYMRAKESRAQLDELGFRHAEIEAGRALFPYGGQRPFFDDAEFALQMQDFLNGCNPYPSNLVYAWPYQCMLLTCDLSFKEAATQGGVPCLQSGDCCIESKKVAYADTVLRTHKAACYNAWLSHCNEAILYFEQPQLIEIERVRTQWDISCYNAQLYTAIAVSGLYVGFMLKSWLWDKKT